MQTIDINIKLSRRGLLLIFFFLIWLVKGFYFVWSEVVSSCQECLGEGAAVAVPARWTVSMAKVAVWIAIGWRGVGNINVISSAECRSIRWNKTYGICSSGTISSCLRQFNRCPSWLVHQWKQKGFGVVLILTAGIYQREKKWKTAVTRDAILILTCETISHVQRVTQSRNKCFLIYLLSSYKPVWVVVDFFICQNKNFQLVVYH